jgi:hypothetical protein
MRRWRQGAWSAMLSACCLAGSVATFGLRGQLRTPGLNKSMNDRHQHARKRPLATEPGELAAAPTRMTGRHPARRRRLLVVPSWAPLPRWVGPSQRSWGGVHRYRSSPPLLPGPSRKKRPPGGGLLTSCARRFIVLTRPPQPSRAALLGSRRGRPGRGASPGRAVGPDPSMLTREIRETSPRSEGPRGRLSPREAPRPPSCQALLWPHDRATGRPNAARPEAPGARHTSLQRAGAASDHRRRHRSPPGRRL